MNELPDEVGDEEKLARFVLFSRHLRADSTLRPDAFMPHPYVELSVNRCMDLADSAVMGYGVAVAIQRRKRLLGAGNLFAKKVRSRPVGLGVRSSPLAENPYHSDICDWPKDKSAQKAKAQILAQSAKFVSA